MNLNFHLWRKNLQQKEEKYTAIVAASCVPQLRDKSFEIQRLMYSVNIGSSSLLNVLLKYSPLPLCILFYLVELQGAEKPIFAIIDTM